MLNIKNIKSVKVQKEKTEKKGLEYSELKITFNKKDIDTHILNAIRRVIHDFIPVYAIGFDNIVIDKNTGYQNNDQIKLRLTQFPVFIKPDIIHYNSDLQEEYDKKEIEIYFNVLNNSQEMRAVTSNDFKIIVDGKEIKNFYDNKYPLLLTILRPGEELIGKCNAVLGIGKNGNQWEPCYKTFYTYDDNNYYLTIHSYGQYTEEELFGCACTIIGYEMKTLKNSIIEIIKSDKEKYNEKINEFEISFNDKTISYLFNSRIQCHSNVKFSGIYSPNMLDNKVVIKVEKKGGNYVNIFTECCDDVCEYIEVIGKAV